MPSKSTACWLIPIAQKLECSRLPVARGRHYNSSLGRFPLAGFAIQITPTGVVIGDTGKLMDVTTRRDCYGDFEVASRSVGCHRGEEGSHRAEEGPLASMEETEVVFIGTLR